ncbi:hypothetical protein AGMMS49546_25560 [Spirochaetia bacterium]|nr:hypothetical protein AGMMS49546_25560 [Spirochaetia bacterium]
MRGAAPLRGIAENPKQPKVATVCSEGGDFPLFLNLQPLRMVIRLCPRFLYRFVGGDDGFQVRVVEVR